MKTKYFFILHVILLLYSISIILVKLAANEPFMSFQFVIYYGTSIFLLVLYAFFWQKVLTHFSLTTAYANKSITIAWGMIWGSLFFQEQIQYNMYIGSVVVFFGIYLVVSSDG
jgi:drug/metabolite transporter (DMT)-like permease